MALKFMISSPMVASIDIVDIGTRWRTLVLSTIVMMHDLPSCMGLHQRSYQLTSEIGLHTLIYTIQPEISLDIHVR